ncbi:MAG: DUF92 domain-containing protein [Euryarchaeota archaeon]|nr:DUF92 domain-containing protein [Euryarchaeota archaeon]
MISAVGFLSVLLLCGILTVISYKFELLTISGSLASFGVGSLIGIFGSINWLVLLIIFALTGFIVTKYKFEVKRKKGLQEGSKGERTYRNVVANGSVPLMVALISFAMGEQGSDAAGIAYLCAISVAASDTVASEMGVLSSKARLITNLEKVEAGTNGGVSAYGTAWAFLGACFASAMGWIVIFPGVFPDARIFIPAVMGFVGCNLDSLIGATLETWGYVKKLGTNILSMALGTVLGYITLILVL